MKINLLLPILLVSSIIANIYSDCGGVTYSHYSAHMLGDDVEETTADEESAE